MVCIQVGSSSYIPAVEQQVVTRPMFRLEALCIFLESRGLYSGWKQFAHPWSHVVYIRVMGIWRNGTTLPNVEHRINVIPCFLSAGNRKFLQLVLFKFGEFASYSLKIHVVNNTDIYLSVHRFQYRKVRQSKTRVNAYFLNPKFLHTCYCTRPLTLLHNITTKWN